ncbi:hypothetical protein Z945_975 [Sulfitobacter noctilucae]|uniref:hypothetical protein n=1 Tax=Sulfitobacter noctilucae TaxID=1342302 RepID=UPI00046889EA|nr:hypothetical protein [Sulfitobacter noctilucae]KIN65928.1 hypothetical protein Z945_975 [Sulfitobacter noctilucae]
MSDCAALEELLAVSQLRYDHQRQAFEKILGKESRLRVELARLDEMGRSTAQEAEAVDSMRAIGADLLWQGWLGRSRTKLNMQLARILAIKEFEQRKVKRAFGKVIALEEVIREQKKIKRADTARRMLDQAVEHSLTNRNENL